jgi:hypothetical protein
MPRPDTLIVDGHGFNWQRLCELRKRQLEARRASQAQPRRCLNSRGVQNEHGRNAYSPLANFCVDTGAICAKIRTPLDSTIFYTLSYTYTFEVVNSLATSRTCRSNCLTQNQVTPTPC